MSLSICLGKGGFDANVLGKLIIGFDLHVMIPLTYEPLEGVLVVVVGPFSMDRYM
jgi:hypothetical protein